MKPHYCLALRTVHPTIGDDAIADYLLREESPYVSNQPPDGHPEVARQFQLPRMRQTDVHGLCCGGV